MNKKYFLSFIILGFGIIISAILINNTIAQTAPNIQYPVAELGNCQNEAACRAYCDKPENMKVCLAFAEKNNLMSRQELEQAKNFMASGAKGPGGCFGKEACEEYCNDISRIDECVSFAEKNNLIPAQELAEAKKVQAAIKKGIKPPPCGNKKQCDVYCNEADHMEECITFGMEAGFIQGKELEDCQKMLAAIKRGVKPPPCQGKEACDEYCQNPDHMETCINFAMEAGFMSEQEKQDSQKMLQALKKGVKPPACKGKEECDVYCSEESHFEECMKFAEAAGFMSPEEAEMARKTGGKGPAGCKGKEECEAFCSNPANQETCFNFAKEHGMISEEDLRKMEEGKQKFQESLTNMPPQVSECLNSAVGTEQMEKFKSGAVMPPREIGDKMRQCFEKTMGPPPGAEMPPGQPVEGQPPMPGQPGMIMQGPGGCKSLEECKAYCETHQEQCQNFKPSTGELPGGIQMGPPVPQGQPTAPGIPTPAGVPACQEGTICPSAPMTPPSGVQPPEGFQPPAGFQPPTGFQAPMQPMTPLPGSQVPAMPPEGQPAPPPPEGTPPAPAPSSLLSPQSLMGLLSGVLNLGFSR